MIFTFRLASILRLLFLVNIWAIGKYHDHLFGKPVPDRFGNFLSGMEIHFPWYAYLLGITLISGYFVNLISSLIHSFTPRWNLISFIYNRSLSVFLYFLEVLFFIALIFEAAIKLKDAFEHREYGLMGTLLESVFGKGDGENLRFLDKLYAFNLLMLLVSSLLFLISFWQTRKLNMIKCFAPE